VTLNYATYGCGDPGDYEWGPDETIHVTGACAPGANALTIHHSTVVKIAEGAYIHLNNAAKDLTVSGTATAPVVFTHEQDNSIGEDVGEGDTPSYNGALHAFYLTTGTTSGAISISNVECRYLRRFWTDNQAAADVTAENLLFHLMGSGGIFSDHLSNAARTVEITNMTVTNCEEVCLLANAVLDLKDIVVSGGGGYPVHHVLRLVDCTGGIDNLWVNGTLASPYAAVRVEGASSDLAVYNATITGVYPYGIYSLAGTVSLYDSIISQCYTGIRYAGTVNVDRCLLGHNRNADTQDDGGTLNETDPITENWVGLERRFETDAIPMFLRQQKSAGGGGTPSVAPAIAAGSRTYGAAGLVGYTTDRNGIPRAPAVAVDLGYHHKLSRMTRRAN
jgi:hypothetical protein